MLGLEFVQGLYRKDKAYADRLSREEIDAIHIPFSLDTLIPQWARENKHIVITGNPGDGKTHLIEKLKDDIAPYCDGNVFLDANAVHDDQLLQSWRDSYMAGTGFCIAINEWPLRSLFQRAPDFEPLKEAWRQVSEALYYESAPEPAQSNIQVVDLNHRNLLSEWVVRQTISKLTSDSVLGPLDNLPPMVQSNVLALRDNGVVDRLCTLLERVGQRGYHATMRQLNGMIAYLLTGGTDPGEQAPNGSPYQDLLFNGQGGLFDAIRESFDPAKTADPLHDDALWSGSTSPETWLRPETANTVPRNVNGARGIQMDSFYSLKRLFFFEHRDGSELLGLVPREEQQFHRLMAGDDTDGAHRVRDLIKAINQLFNPQSRSEDDNSLSLWMTHRYDTQAPTSYMALNSVEASQFRTSLQSQAPWLESWMEEDFLFLHKRFGYISTGPDAAGQAVLEVDLELYLTLRDAAKGFTSSVWSQSAVRRVVKFIGDLNRIHGNPSPLQEVQLQSTHIPPMRLRLDTARLRYEL